MQKEVILLATFSILSYALVKFFHLQAQDSLHPLFPWIVKAIPLTFLLSAGYFLLVQLREANEKVKLLRLPGYTFEILIALGFVGIIHKLHPPLFIDDSGFILRYLDHFAEGYFYTFNPADGSAFGISSFSFGIFTGFLSWTHLFTPENSLIFANYLGLFLTGFFLFRILGQTQLKAPFRLFIWLIVMAGSKSYLLMSTSGMETTMVSATVFAALYFLLKNQPRWMWAMLALTAISKLDMVPLVVVIAAFYGIKNLRGYLPVSIKNKEIQALAFFGILPVLLYIGFTWIVFGSPLPLSAHSKMFHHYHPEGFFPWFEYFHNTPFKASHLFPMLLLWLGHHLLAVEQKQWNELRFTVFGWAFVATSALYYIYNPGERMMWYYCLPDLLLLLQLGVSAVRVFQLFPKITGLSLFSIVMIGFLVLNWNKMLKEVTYYEQMTGRVERERTRIGEYIETVTTENDSIASGHGLISRKAKGYVIDMVGLNNALATQYELRLDYVVKDLHPKWVIMHAYYDVIDLMSVEGYRLNHTFYDIALNWYPAFRLFERIDPPGNREWVHPLQPDRLSGDGEVKQVSSILHVRGKNIEMRPSKEDSLGQVLKFGVKLTDQAQMFNLKIFYGDSLMDQIGTGVGPLTPERSQTEEFTWYRPNYRLNHKMTRIEISSKEELVLLDPVLVVMEGYREPEPDCVEPVEENP